LRRDPVAVKATKQPKKARRTAPEHLPSQALPLWEKLRELRMSISREQGVPPFVVFHDSTLLAMADAMPASRQDLLLIAGIGEKKAERYGEQFLDVIETHQSEQDQ
jgi:ATP-dependent DNA helicase RecQ